MRGSRKQPVEIRPHLTGRGQCPVAVWRCGSARVGERRAPCIGPISAPRSKVGVAERGGGEERGVAERAVVTRRTSTGRKGGILSGQNTKSRAPKGTKQKEEREENLNLLHRGIKIVVQKSRRNSSITLT